MRISDWSSDVCSSDLCHPTNLQRRGQVHRRPHAELKHRLLRSRGIFPANLPRYIQISKPPSYTHTPQFCRVQRLNNKTVSALPRLALRVCKDGAFFAFVVSFVDRVLTALPGADTPPVCPNLLSRLIPPLP